MASVAFVFPCLSVALVLFVRGSSPWSNGGRRIRHGNFGQAGVQCIKRSGPTLRHKTGSDPLRRGKLLAAENEVARHGSTNVFDDCPRVSSFATALDNHACTEDGTGSAAATASRLGAVGWTSSELPD